ncbi:hypothetical protein ACLGIH_06810 [Streptomyces sp. HMX87]|uniref:hypothetical protein n=1 Tax=Streptomyces sp. HMX87 TaxID=3390849 RepID=UPI003A87EE05
MPRIRPPQRAERGHPGEQVAEPEGAQHEDTGARGRPVVTARRGGDLTAGHTAGHGGHLTTSHGGHLTTGHTTDPGRHLTAARATNPGRHHTTGHTSGHGGHLTTGHTTGSGRHLTAARATNPGRHHTTGHTSGHGGHLTTGHTTGSGRHLTAARATNAGGHLTTGRAPPVAAGRRIAFGVGGRERRARGPVLRPWVPGGRPDRVGEEARAPRHRTPSAARAIRAVEERPSR